MTNRDTGKPNATAQARSRARWCVIVPAYHEEKCIGRVIREIHEHCPDVVVVDDGSTDNTLLVAEQAGAIVIRHETNMGKGIALNSGFSYAQQNGFDFVIVMDADGQHAPGEIPRFVEAYVRTGIPVLIGNRMADVHSMPLVRRCTNRFMSWLLSREMGQYVPDTQCGFRLYRSDVIPFVSTESVGYAAESEILLHIAERGIRIDNVPISTIYGDEQSSVHPVRDTWRFFNMLRRYRRARKAKQRRRWFR